MAKNTEVFGIAAILLIIAARGQGTQGPLRPGGELLKTFEIGSLLNDFHKMTGIMNRVDNLGQMALHPPDPPKLPPPDELFSKAMPDLSNIVENMAPLMAAFGLNPND